MSVLEFYPDKLSRILTDKKISFSELSRKADISRVTLWRIEKGEIQPKEKYIRSIAKVLNVGVEEISSLPQEVLVTDKDIIEEKKFLKKWISFDDIDEAKRIESQNSILSAIQEKFNESTKAVRLIRTLINFSDAMLYVKDHRQKYMAASKAFLELLSIPSELNIFGKTDLDVFGSEEARKNTDEDQQVIFSGESIKNREDYIPGSRKKRYGLISKIPTFDNKGKLTGLIGSFIDITQRKKTEFLANDLKRCIEFLENRIIWFGSGKIVELKNKSLYPKELVYVSNSLVVKSFAGCEKIFSDYEHMEFLDSLKELPVAYDLEKLRTEGFSTIYYRIKSPDNKQIINCKSSIYCIGKYDLYFGITELDVIKTYTDFLLNDLSGLGLDKVTTGKINQIINSCEQAMQARIDYDKFINMREKTKD